MKQEFYAVIEGLTNSCAQYEILGRSVLEQLYSDLEAAGAKAIFALDEDTTHASLIEEHGCDAIFAIVPANCILVSDFIDGEGFHYISINNPVDLENATASLRRRINEKHMIAGVLFMDATQAFIAPDVKIGTGTTILPGCIILGKTVIGQGCTIGPNSRLVDMTIGDDVTIEYSVASEAEIGTGTSVGPFAYLRPGTVIGEKCRIGNFVEVKNAILGDGAKMAHLAYIGDADVGRGVNYSCGAITANYDGKNKHRTVIGDYAFIGSNANLVAPVEIEGGAFVAAGSTINKNVPQDALGIARARQTNVEGWRKRR